MSTTDKNTDIAKNTSWSIPHQQEQNYINIIQQSLISPKTFDIFRDHPHYTTILGNGMPGNEIEAYWSEIQQDDHIMSKLDVIKQMDNVGGPPIDDSIGMCKRNLKYLYSAMMVNKYFDNIKNIVEIGVGYGGLCFTLDQYLSLDGYQLIDIDCAAKLAKKFLLTLKNYPSDFFNPRPSYDLAISECAISELNQTSIEYYYNKILSKSNALFIKTNFAEPHRLNDLVKMINQRFKTMLIQDIPNTTDPPTVIVGWKK